jgi:hypothetical protein
MSGVGAYCFKSLSCWLETNCDKKHDAPRQHVYFEGIALDETFVLASLKFDIQDDLLLLCDRNMSAALASASVVSRPDRPAPVTQRAKAAQARIESALRTTALRTKNVQVRKAASSAKSLKVWRIM